MTAEKRKTLWAYVFLIPTLILYAIIVIYPVFSAFFISLNKWPVFGQKMFIGFGNYVRMVKDPLFWQSLKVTVIWTSGVVPLVMIIGLAVAIVLNAPWLRLKGLFRTIYFVPVVTSMVASGFVWRWLFEPSMGVINWFINLLGLPSPGWLASTTWAIVAVMIVGIWKQIGYAMVLFLAGLQTIPKEINEAAEIDGASSWQVFCKVTIPLLNPTIVFVAVMMVINAFRVFTIPYVMTAGGLTYLSPGGPLNSTRVFVYHIYDLAFKRFDMGYGSANAFFLLVIILIVTLIQMKVINKPFEY